MNINTKTALLQCQYWPSKTPQQLNPKLGLHFLCLHCIIENTLKWKRFADVMDKTASQLISPKMNKQMKVKLANTTELDERVSD